MIDLCNYYFSCISLLSQQHHHGIEIIQEHVTIEYSPATIQEILSLSLDIIRSVITRDIETKKKDTSDGFCSTVTYWILFHRFLLLNAGNVKKGGISAGGGEEGESSMGNDRDDDDGGNIGFGGDEGVAVAADDDDAAFDAFGGGDTANKDKKKKKKGETVDAAAEKDMVSFDNYSGLLSYYRDEVLLSSLPSSQEILFNSVLLKEFCLEMMNTLFSRYVLEEEDGKSERKNPSSSSSSSDKEIFSFHSDIIASRQRITNLLSQKHKFLKSEIVHLPIYSLSLFLNDLISTSCIMSTYSINDKNIISIQQEGIHFLFFLLSLFITTLDPDAFTAVGSAVTGKRGLEGEEGNVTENLIVFQYLSQILGAIRHVFGSISLSYYSIHYFSQEILLLLMKAHFITDKVMFKRLIKTLTSSFEEQMKISSLFYEDGKIKEEYRIITSLSGNHGNLSEVALLKNLFLNLKIAFSYVQLSSLLSLSPSVSPTISLLLFENQSMLSSFPKAISLMISSDIITISLKNCEFLELFSSSFLIIDCIRIVQTQKEEMIKQLRKRKRQMTRQGKSSDELPSTLEEEKGEEESPDLYHPLRGGQVYSYLVHISDASLTSLMEEILISSIVSYFLRRSVEESTKKKPSTPSSASSSMSSAFFDETSWIKNIYSFLSLKLQLLLGNEEDPSCGSKDTFNKFMDCLLSLMNHCLSTNNSNKVNREDAGIGRKDFLQLLTLLTLILKKQNDLNMFSSSASSSSCLSLKLFQMMRLLLEESKVSSPFSSSDLQVLTQFYFSLMESMNPFFSNDNSNNTDVKQRLHLLSSSCAPQGIQAAFLEHQLALQCFQAIHSAVFVDPCSSTGSDSATGEYFFHYYVLLGLASVSIVDHAKAPSLQQLYYEFFKKFVLVSTVSLEMIQKQFHFVISLLWNSFQSSFSSKDQPSETRFFSLLKVLLPLLQVLYDHLLSSASVTATASAATSFISSLKKVFDTVFSSMVLTCQACSSPLFYRSFLQHFCTFFQQDSLLISSWTDCSPSTSGFMFVLLECYFPLLLLQLTPITDKPSQKTVLVITDNETRLLIHKLFVLFFHQINSVYSPSNPDSDSDQREAVIKKILSLSLPVYCSHIKYFSTSGENQQTIVNYFVVIGKCLTNIVQLISTEFRSYLVQNSTEEEKQLLQSVMKLALTSSANPAESSSSTQESTSSSGNLGKLNVDKFKK
jgi:hypothetical protein